MSGLRRTFVSLLLAVVVVAGLSILAIATFLQRPAYAPLVAFEVQQATPAQVAIAQRQSRGEPPPQRSAAPPDPVRTRRGFVQLAFDVLQDGQPDNIRVVGAVPSGFYETQAIASVAARRFPPGAGRSEIVEFDYAPTSD